MEIIEEIFERFYKTLADDKEIPEEVILKLKEKIDWIIYNIR